MSIALTELVEITPENYDVEFDIRYASYNNFTEKPVYSAAKCFLHVEAAVKLRKAIKLASKLGYRIKIFDAFRPSEAQYKLWEHTPDANFLAPPDKGSPHSRGVAIDLTLIDSDGNELDMGTDFDAFTELSHHANTKIPAAAQQNRFILLGIMTASGWDNYMNEWWHYQLFNSREYKIYTDLDAKTGMM